MAPFQQKLFQNLVDHLSLDSSEKRYFKNGSLTKLIIHDQSNLWSFRVALNSLLPFKAFKDFTLNLDKVFDSAKVRITIDVTHPKITGDLIKDYWPWVIKHCGLSKLMAQQLLKDGQLVVTNEMISLKTRDEALRGFLVNGALVQIENMYQRLGFPSFKINIPGSQRQRKLPTKIKPFSIKKQPKDIKLAREAAQDLDHGDSK